MKTRRIERINSLLKEVLSETIRLQVKHPKVSELFTITKVEVTNDLRQAKVFVSVIGSEKEKQETVNALQTSAHFIEIMASKTVTLRFFPQLHFYLDTTLEQQIKIETLLEKATPPSASKR